MNNSAFTFQTLHPDTIMDALFEHGIRVDSGLTPLNSYENRVYQFQDEDRRRFVVKFYRPERWTADQILEEHQFALQLVNDEVPVAAPVAFNGQTLLNHQGFYFAVFPSVGGRQFEADNIDQMEAVGRYLGRMHQTGRKQLFIHRPTIGLNKWALSAVSQTGAGFRKGCSVAVNAGVSQRLLSRQYRQWCCRDAVFAWTAQ